MKSGKIMRGILLRLTFLAFIGVAFSLIVLNVGNVKYMLNDSLQRNRRYTLSASEKINWTAGSLPIYSEKDPILVFPHLNCYVENISLEMILEPEIPYIDVFYINEEHPKYGDTVLRIENPDLNTTVAIDDMVSDLRIDLGDDAGITLSAFSVIVNPVKLKFSWSIVAAVELIYWCGKFLFFLQRTPEYDLQKDTPDVPETEDSP